MHAEYYSLHSLRTSVCILYKFILALAVAYALHLWRPHSDGQSCLNTPAQSRASFSTHMPSMRKDSTASTFGRLTGLGNRSTARNQFFQQVVKIPTTVTGLWITSSIPLASHFLGKFSVRGQSSLAYPPQLLHLPYYRGFLCTWRNLPTRYSRVMLGTSW